MPREPVHVLQVMATLLAGGAERLVQNLAAYLDPERFKVHVVAFGERRGNPLKEEFDRLGTPVRVLGAHKMYDPRVTMQLARTMREWRIDLVHTHLMNPDILGRIAGRSLGLPVISTLHNIPESYEQDAFYRYWLQRATARALSTRLVAVSESIREMYIRRWKIPPARICTITNGVPLERFLGVAPGVPARAAGEGPLITNVGRLTPQKGQRQLLDAARIVLERRPDARFMIVGAGNLEQELRAHAAAIGVGGRVEFAGIRHDIPEILGQSDVFVLSSLWEGMPVSAIEAMAAARPVVLTDVGGVRDLVRPGADGLTVPPDDPPALAAALLSLLDDPALRQRLAAAGRARVQQEFSMEMFIQRHEQLYSELLTRSRSAGDGRRPTVLRP